MKTPEARDLAIGLTLGLISATDVIEWADSWILQLDEPPYWLIEVSTTPKVTLQDLLNLIPVRANDYGATDQEFLGAMAVRSIDKGESLGGIVRLMYERFCFCDWTEMTEVRQQIYIIDDEWDWDQSRAVQTARAFLMPYLSVGRSLLEKIKSGQDVDDNAGGRV